MKKYVIIVNNSKYKDYMYINIFGTGKSQRLLIKYIEKMLKIDPVKRISCKDALNHVSYIFILYYLIYI